MRTKYRKKPVVIEAIQFSDETKDQCFNFVTCNRASYFDKDGNPVMDIHTLNGIVRVTLGEWIIKGVHGEFYPCADEIFRKTHEPADNTRTDPAKDAMRSALVEMVNRLDSLCTNVFYPPCKCDHSVGFVCEICYDKSLVSRARSALALDKDQNDAKP